LVILRFRFMSTSVKSASPATAPPIWAKTNPDVSPAAALTDRRGLQRRPAELRAFFRAPTLRYAA
jgi:hypothetical protein